MSGGKITAHIEMRADDQTRGHVVVSCPLKGECWFPVWTQPAKTATWQWASGPPEAPTISPSIGCEANCGRHFTIVNGVGQ